MTKLMKNNLSKPSGFTITELIVSVAIIALVSSITLTNYHEGNQVAKLNAETYKLANLVREVQDWALGAKKDSNGALPGAWGLEFSTADNSSVRIVRYDVFESAPTAVFTERTVDFADGVTVGALNAPGNANQIYLVFIPPDPVTLICNGNLDPSNCTPAQFDIRLDDRFSTKSRVININTFGLIDIN